MAGQFYKNRTSGNRSWSTMTELRD